MIGRRSFLAYGMPLVVGNDNRNYPDVAQLFDYRLLSCTVCGVLFVEKQ